MVQARLWLASDGKLPADRARGSKGNTQLLHLRGLILQGQMVSSLKRSAAHSDQLMLWCTPRPYLAVESAGTRPDVPAAIKQSLNTTCMP